MGTPIWGDSPPLVYFAEPIDKASGQNFTIAASMVTTLATWGCTIFRPSAGFRATQPDPRVEQINRHALYRADIIVAYLSETTPSIGVPAEIEAATARGIPAVVHYTGQSFVLAGNPLVTVIDEAPTLIGAVEHALKEHPRPEPESGILTAVSPTYRLPFDPEELAEQQRLGGIYDSVVEAAHKILTNRSYRTAAQQAAINLARTVEQCTHGGDCEIHPDVRGLHNYDQIDPPRLDPLNLELNRLRLIAAEQAAHPVCWIAGEPEPIRVVLAEGAEPPRRAYTDDAGLDLTTAHEITIQPGEYKDVRTQVTGTQLPTGYHAQIVGRSSALRKWRLHIPQAIIDPGWRGPLFVGVWNLGGNPVTLKPGDRVGQLILIPNNPAPVQVVTQVDDHARGLKGFGSSG